MPDSIISRVFMSGNSQAVRLPREYRLDTDTVEITRNAAGDLILHPVPSRRGTALLDLLAEFDDDFTEALGQDRANQPPVQERVDL